MTSGPFIDGGGWRTTSLCFIHELTGLCALQGYFSFHKFFHVLLIEIDVSFF